MRSLMIFGAASGTGLEVARLASSPGSEVTAFVRRHTPELEALRISQCYGDMEERRDVETAYCAVPGVEGVVCTVSSGPYGSDRPFHGVRHAVDGAVQAGVSHFVLISSLGAGESKAYASERLLEALGRVLEEKTEAENYLKCSGLAYTIVRPGGLVDEPITDNGCLLEDPSAHGRISRRDLASLIMKALCRPEFRQKVFSAVDRAFLS